MIWAPRFVVSSRSAAATSRFKRKEDKPSFCAANEAGTFRPDGERIKLPVIGWLRMREEVRFSGPLKRATVSCDAGRWFVSVLVDTNDVRPVAQPEAVVGIAEPRWLTTLATLSTGETIEKAHGGEPPPGPRRLGWWLPRISSADRIQSAAVWRAHVVVAGRWYPSSKTCSCCGVIKSTLVLAERMCSAALTVISRLGGT